MWILLCYIGMIELVRPLLTRHVSDPLFGEKSIHRHTLFLCVSDDRLSVCDVAVTHVVTDKLLCCDAHYMSRCN